MKNEINNENNGQGLPVTFWKQGGLQAEGTAIGRKGTKILIAYKINSGEKRERWLTASRVVRFNEGSASDLPRYIGASCKGGKLAKPLDMFDEANTAELLKLPGIERNPGFGHSSGSAVHARGRLCERCGWKHTWIRRFERAHQGKPDRYMLTGWSARKLEDVLAPESKGAARSEGTSLPELDKFFQ